MPGSPARRAHRGTRRLTVLAAALAAAGCAAVLPAGAAGAAAAPTTTHSAATPATVTCNSPSVPVYHVDALGQLRRWSYTAPLDGSSGWTEQLLGTGWGGQNVISEGGGVLFAIDASGNLRWYQDDSAGSGEPADWDPASGSVIGTGWSGYTQVFSGGQGVLYAIDAAGDLHWYQYQGTSGSVSWANGGGSVIGTAWGGYSQVFSGGAGIVFAVDGSGTLYWYRHQNPAAGANTWANGGTGAPIGSGWSQFTQIGSVGGGVLFARDSTGAMQWYRDTDPLGGTASWADGAAGVNEGSGWGPAQVVGDVASCTAT